MGCVKFHFRRAQAAGIRRGGSFGAEEDKSGFNDATLAIGTQALKRADYIRQGGKLR
jgi:hypothetical protein